MSENLDFILQIIKIDLFYTFGLYSFLYIFISCLLKNEKIEVIDEISNKIIVFSGLVFLLIWISLIFINYMESSEYERLGIIQRMFGKYWFGYWLQPIIWFSLSQFLRFKKVRENKTLRLIFSVLFIVSIEQYVILLTSFQRDYLPSSWSFNISTKEFIIGIITKLLSFMTIVILYYLIEKKLKEYINNTVK